MFVLVVRAVLEFVAGGVAGDGRWWEGDAVRIAFIGFAASFLGAQMPQSGRPCRTPAAWIAKRAEVCLLRRQGKSYREIARTQKCSIHFIRDALQRKSQTGSHKDRPRTGRPRKATPTIVKRTKALLLERAVGSVRKARAKLRAEGIDLSRGTVHNIAHRADLRSAVPIPKPKLTEAHRAARLAWTRLHENDDELTIRSRVFADEKSFRVTDVSHRVWLRPIDPTPIRETRKCNAHVHMISTRTPWLLALCHTLIPWTRTARCVALRVCTFFGCDLGGFSLVQKNSQQR